MKIKVTDTIAVMGDFHDWDKEKQLDFFRNCPNVTSKAQATKLHKTYLKKYKG